MPNSASSAKRVRQQERNRLRNRARKSALKTETRKVLDAIQGNDPKAALERFRSLTKRLDQTAAKGTLHKNTAARRKSRLARRIAALSAKKS
jgi:small subunit ribosomal protein S20